MRIIIIMAKFRKKPVVIEAVQLLWSTWGEMCEHANVGHLANSQPEGCFISPEDGTPTKDLSGNIIGLQIPTLEGVMLAREGDWVIKGVQGELYPCKPDIFHQTYEPLPTI